MRNLIALLTTVAAISVSAADNPTPQTAIALEPYGIISWTGLNGSSELGAGASLNFGITKNLSIVGFGEADDTQNTFIDRAGIGLRYTAWLGKSVSLDAGGAGAYDFERENFFLRLPLGANFYILKGQNVDLSIRGQYAFDLDGNGKTGTATGRAFLGPVFNAKF